jgi:hypothetical protein
MDIDLDKFEKLAEERSAALAAQPLMTVEESNEQYDRLNNHSPRQAPVDQSKEEQEDDHLEVGEHG